MALGCAYIFTAIILLLRSTKACEYTYGRDQDLDWWKTSIIYQIYPRSFKDSNSDGIGDLNGITSKLEHVADIGADALWLSPIFSSPQVDFGYDISNFTNVDTDYGTLADFDRLTATAKKLGLKVLLDFVPNHSSPEHDWFKKSIMKIPPYDEYYIWKDAKIVNGERKPPNNWLSVFGKSAWEWNANRQQYYFHQFAIGQPDLNYRNPKLRQEMEDVLTFWMSRGVDGFRVDAVNHMFEDERGLDEDPSGKDVPEDDYEYLDHKYTRDQKETYEVVQSWTQLLVNFEKRYKTPAKFMIMEAYTSIPLSMKFYEVGANPFNFMFVADLKKESTPLDFKYYIDNWMNVVPEGKIPNWVTGNHDNHRVASRYGIDREDELTMLSVMLPGITVVYNGDEIGMVDRFFTFEETVDPPALIAGPDRYLEKTRDPERTPYQWDATDNAGFSTGTKTWLPVNDNYVTLNLAAQKVESHSHYKVFKRLSALKKKSILKKGDYEVLAVAENVLAVIRRLPNEVPVVLLINYSDSEVEFDALKWLNIQEKMFIYVASVASNLESGVEINSSNLKLPARASIILSSNTLASR